MVGFSTALLATVLASLAPMVPVSGGNALTLPAQRHAVRIDTGSGRPPTWLLTVQQEGAEGRGLSFFRSDDGGRTFRFAAAIQPDASHADRAEVLAVGRDVALVYSFEAPRLTASRRHDVYFQWWRYRPETHDWAPQPAVRVFDADDTTAYSRALLARDSRGRLWVQAFRLDSDGGSTAVLSVSTDGGASFQRQANLGRVKRRGGGRLLSLGSKLVFVYAMHDGFEPTRLRLRDDADPLDTWSAVRDAFSEGIYHGAALSAVADGRGGMHLVYKDESERLYHRHFNGSTFGPRTLLEGSRDWAMQAATTRIGDTLYVFYNTMREPNVSYEVRARVLKDGRFSEPVVLDSRRTYKGYPNALETLPEGTSEVPCFFGDAPDANSRGYVSRVSLAVPGGGGGDDAPPDEDEDAPGSEPQPGELLFGDTFPRTSSSSLGSDWKLSGLWLTDGRRAVSDLDNPNGDNLAFALPSRCDDCQVQARLQAFGADEAGLVVRAEADARYALVLLPQGRLQLRRYGGGGFIVLGETASGLAAPWEAATLSLSVWGAGPVRLSASVEGQVRLRVTDDDPAALTGEGYAGLATPIAGVWFDDFLVRALGTGP
ncbi:hypothetical protein ATI61_110361 [Archangium gephyra]|uniref:Exo-alpha-sialidase n=1 Tax=Archangium gephyra TaxID=48 RepID=A0ABX9JUV9_9BACT|nr:hypothetical protein [Archangium gephyra]REG27354.1 hypothetical protein ATI61_110361 [Archangium gephyra]